MSRSRPAEPAPVSGATGVDLEATLSWRPGHEAARTRSLWARTRTPWWTAPPRSVRSPSPSYEPASLQFGTTYYWKVSEVNEAATPSAWDSEVWSFTTREYAVVDDFESYNDDEAVASTTTWIDGLANKSGSVVGYSGPVRGADDPPRRRAVDAAGVQQRQDAVLQRGGADLGHGPELDRQWGRHAGAVLPGPGGRVRGEIGRQYGHGRRRGGYLECGRSVPLCVQAPHRQWRDRRPRGEYREHRPVGQVRRDDPREPGGRLRYATILRRRATGFATRPAP